MHYIKNVLISISFFFFKMFYFYHLIICDKEKYAQNFTSNVYEIEMKSFSTCYFIYRNPK